MAEYATRLACAAVPDAGLDAAEARLRPHIPKQVWGRFARQLRTPDRLRSMLGHLLLRHLLRSMGVADAAWSVQLAPFGKPLLAGPEGIEFNISHAGNWVVCAVSPQPVGIDVELVRETDLGIARRFFHSGEYLDLMALLPAGRLDYFFRLWTAKEAYVKALGAGLQRDLASFHVTPGASGAVQLCDPQDLAGRFRLAHLNFDERYRLALCTSVVHTAGPMARPHLNQLLG